LIIFHNLQTVIAQKAKNKSVFAQRLGLTPSALTKSFQANRPVTLIQALAIEAEFGIRRQWLLEDEGSMEKGFTDLSLEDQISLISLKKLALKQLRLFQVDSFHKMKFSEIIGRKRKAYESILGSGAAPELIRDVPDPAEDTVWQRPLLKFQETTVGNKYVSDNDQLEDLMGQARSILGVGLENRANFDTEESNNLNYELMLARMEAIHSEMEPESVIKSYPDSACSRINHSYLAEVKGDADQYISHLHSAEKLFQDELFQRAFAQSKIQNVFDSVAAKSIVEKTPTEKIQQLWLGDIQIEELLKHSTSPR